MRSFLTSVLWVAVATAAVGCSGGETPGDSSSTTKAGSQDTSRPGAPKDRDTEDRVKEDREKKDAAESSDSSQVFPEHLTQGFEREVSAPIPGGGIASVGLICRGSGADVFYFGVKNASSLPDGQHAVKVDGMNEKFRFATGAPDSGVGVGAAQAAFQGAEYTFRFDEIDVVISIAGCGH